MTTEQKTISEFIAEAGVTMKAEWVDRNPYMSDFKGSHYKVTLRAGRSRMTTYFSMGYAHTSEPTVADVLDCLASDASGVENARGDFEEWASEYGYDTDSRKAAKTFKACEKSAAKLRALLGDSAYETLLWNTERE